MASVYKTVCVAIILALAIECQSASAAVGQIDAQAEVAAAVYSAYETSEQVQKISDQRLLAQQGQISALERAVKAGDVKRRAELTAAQNMFVAALAEKDHEYAATIAVFRANVTDIAATPEGLNALARFNAGDQVGALTILDKLRSAHDQARQARSDIESAAEARRIAALALEGRAQEQEAAFLQDAAENGSHFDANGVNLLESDKYPASITLDSLIVRYEDITKLDPSVFDDWVQLSQLYHPGSQNADHALQHAYELAASPEDKAKISGLLAIGAKERGNLTGALQWLDEEADFDSQLHWADRVALNSIQVGDILMEQGQFDHADLEFKNAQNALEQFLPLLPHDLDPARRALVERLLPYALNERGKLLLEEGDIQGAQSVMLESIAGYHAMTLSYPGNNAWFLMMGGSRGALAEVYLLGGDSDKALDAANAMNRDFQSANSPTGDAGDCVIFGRVLNARHELQKAVKVYEGCLAMAQPESEYMADALGYYGDALLASGNPVGALKQFTQELELARRLAGIDATNADAISGVAAALARLAEVPSSGVSWREVVAEYELRKKVGSLTSADQHQLTAALAAIERQ